MTRYEIAEGAKRDLDEILDYFLAVNLEAGERFVQAFNRKCQNLVNFPSIGRSYDHIAQIYEAFP
jgi:toxin ParE1/3/4